ncbi:cyclophilin-like fold protein [Actinoplanes sp. NPDC004185]
MPASRTAVRAALVTIVAGCGGPDRSADTPVNASATAPATPRPSGPAAASPQEEQMKISIVIGDQRFAATIRDSAAGRDLIAQLPLTIAMTDHGSVEKTGPLPSPLSLDGQPDGADPDVGDVGYYAPGNDLVLYYGDQSYYPGIVILGHLDGDAAGRIAGMEGAVTATVDVRAG